MLSLLLSQWLQSRGGPLSISLIWTILLYGWTASEIYIAIATRTRQSGGQVRDRGSMLILWVTIIASITAAEFARNLTQFIIFPGFHALRLIAIPLFVTGLVVRWVAIFSLGKAFSANVAIRDTQSLYRSGLYSVVRHPSYSGMLISFLAIGLADRNWLSAAIVLILPAAALLYRIHVEEAALLSAFGVQYAEYSMKTKRLIPGVY
jgi:protein-S-isoprenylcysteine O-methyltransferase Ste14